MPPNNKKDPVEFGEIQTFNMFAYGHFVTKTVFFYNRPLGMMAPLFNNIAQQ